MAEPFSSGLEVELGKPVGPLGFIPRGGASGTSVWEYEVDTAHFNPHGVLHGGVVMALLDTAMGFAVASLTVPNGRINAAAQMSVSFLAPVRTGVVRAEARVVKLGKRLAFVDGEAFDSSGQRIATATASHAILP